MKTNILKAEQDNLALAVAHDFDLGIPVVVPTETVYGLAAPFNKEEIVQNIFKIKNRPSDNPLIVHISDLGQLQELIDEELTSGVQKLIEKFWPGPLTILFKKADRVLQAVTANSHFVAVRMPAHPVFRGLIASLDCPLVAPSANLSGNPSPTNALDALEDLDGLVRTIIDGGQSEFGLESTVIKIVANTEVVILRPGFVTKEMLLDYFEKVEYVTESGNIVESPGTKYRHYAPRNAKVVLIEDFNLAPATLTKNDVLITFSQKLDDSIFYESEDLLAKDIFRLLRKFDREGIQTIYIEKPIKNEALLNRLKKASETK